MSTANRTKKPAAAQAETDNLTGQPPTPLEHTERVITFVDYDLCQEENLLWVTVAAQKTARALQLAIQGMSQELEHSVTSQEDIDLLAEMAVGLRLFCDQAKTLAAKQLEPAKAA